MNFADDGVKTADCKLDVSQWVLVLQQWVTSLNEAHNERLLISLSSSVLGINYAADGAKNADDVSQNFLSLSTQFDLI